MIMIEVVSGSSSEMLRLCCVVLVLFGTPWNTAGAVDFAGDVTCVHNPSDTQIQHTFQKYDTNRGRRQNAPFRMAVHYDSSLNDIPEESRMLLQNVVIPETVAFFSGALSPRSPLTGPILLNRLCTINNNVVNLPEEEVACTFQCEETSFCIVAPIPENHLRRCIECNGQASTCAETGEDGAGVANADFIFYVSTRNQHPCGGNVLAFAGVCALEQSLDRPVAGNANFCPLRIPQLSAEELIAIAKHELTHALAFSRVLFPYYRNDDGTPQTPRDASGRPADIAGQLIISQNTIKTLTYNDWETRNGDISHSIRALVTPNVLAQGAIHYGCSQFLGAELESQDSTIPASHWEIRTLGNEVMASSLQDNPRFSRMTLALFQDSGWYDVDYSMVEEHAWGRRAGCRFSHGSCGEWISTRGASGGSLQPFCDTLNSRTRSCSADRLGFAQCNLIQRQVPPEFQYFSNPGLGGAFSRADYCPYNRATGDGSQCANTALQPVNNVLAETYGPGSLCVEVGAWTKTESGATTASSPLDGSGCYQYSCSSETGVTIFVLGRAFVCPSKDEVIPIDITVSGVRYQGSLICPSCTELCYDELSNCPSGVSTTTTTITPTTTSTETSTPTSTTSTVTSTPTSTTSTATTTNTATTTSTTMSISPTSTPNPNPAVVPVEVRFEENVYRVNEGVASQHLALFVCIIANSTERDFTVTLTPVSITALAGADFIEKRSVLHFQAGGSAQECGCVGIIDDTAMETREAFGIIATVDAPLMTFTGQRIAVVVLEDNTDSVMVGFVQQDSIISENTPSVSVCISIVEGSLERNVAFEINQVGGTASASTHLQVELPVVLNLDQPTPMSCFPLTVLDYGTAGDIILELRTLDTEIASRVSINPSQMAIIIENSDEEVEDTRLFFIKDTPNVSGNSVTAEFEIGSSFSSVTCSVTMQEEKDCSGGAVTFSGLNPDRGREFTLVVTGRLPNGETRTLSRGFHVGTIVTCSAHLINNGITVRGDTVTIEWQGTGPGANVDPPLSFLCKIQGINNFEECTSPHSVSSPQLLVNGDYTIIIRHNDPAREVCTHRNIAHIGFQITDGT